MKSINILRASVSALILTLNINHAYATDSGSRSYQMFLNEYQELFLDDVQKLHFEGRHEQALEKKHSNLKFVETFNPEIPTEESFVQKDRQDKLINEISEKLENKMDEYEKNKQDLSEVNEYLSFCGGMEAFQQMRREKKDEYNNHCLKIKHTIGAIRSHRAVYEAASKATDIKTLEQMEQMELLWKQMDQLYSSLDEEEKQMDLLKSEVKNHDKIVLTLKKGDLSVFKDEIEKLRKQIDFVKRNEFFLSPKPRPRAIIHGTSSDPSLSSLGEGVIIGIIDFFPQNLSSFPCKLLDGDKVINPEFNGSVKPGEEDYVHNHGIQLSSIAVSNDKKEDSDFIGQAPGAKIEYFDQELMSSSDEKPKFLNFSKPISQGKTSLEAHISFIEAVPKFEREKFEREKAYLIYQMRWLLDHTDEDEQLVAVNMALFSFNDMKDSNLLNTKARIMNMSMNLDNEIYRYETFSSSNPHGSLSSLIYLRFFADLDVLSVTTIGNNGMYLSTSKGYVIKKALVKANDTRDKIILVGSLLEDGLTIRSNSNQPGDDFDLQEHTLFALGSNVPCLFLNTNTYGEESDTSYATPHVSGAAAIVMSQFPTLSAKDVSKCLRKGATPILLGTDGLPYELTDCDAGTAITIHPELEGEIKRSRAKYGMGRLNIRGALERAGKMGANSQR